MKDLIERCFKRIDGFNRIGIPSVFIKKLGKEFYVELYEDHIKLVPLKKIKGE